ncbi:MAG: SH3 domain-containing protein [Pseudomonadota bacterium]|nr:SH3 domain-containing protein [Pseudomonadota bacterium]
MKALLTIFIALGLTFVFTGSVQALEDEESESGLALPRMVSLRSSLINVRSGPGSRYPIEWVYKQKGAPVEIIAEFEIWRKIRDWEGSETWVHKAMLSGRRFVKVMTPGENNIYAKPETDSRIIAKAEDGVVGEIEKCPTPDGMCLIKFDTVKGWMPRNGLFGIYKDEVIK